MKLMIVIVQEQDFEPLARLLIRNRVRATKFQTEGLYSNKKNITLLICVEADREEEILDYIRKTHEEYMQKTRSVEEDCEFITRVCSHVLSGVLCLAEEPVLVFAA